VLAVRDGVAVASETGEVFELTALVERDTPGNRMNDAKCDPAGRLLAGTTAFDFSPHSAALYRVEPDWSFEQIVRDVTQSNGIAWSPSGSRMYFIDSATQGCRRLRLRRRHRLGRQQETARRHRACARDTGWDDRR